MTEPASIRPPDDEPDVWTPNNVTRSTSVPDRHDESEARADK